MRLIDAVPMIASVLDHFDKLSPWEQDFIAGLVRIGASGKMRSLTDNQEDTLAGLYCRTNLAPLLPDTHRTKAQEDERKHAAETAPHVVRGTFHNGATLDPVRYMTKSKAWVDEIEKAAVMPLRDAEIKVRILRRQFELKGKVVTLVAVPVPEKAS